MKRKHVLRLIALILVTVSMLLTACGGGSEDEAPVTSAPSADSNNDDAVAESNDDAADAPAVEEPTATLTLKEQFPDLLVVHPDGFDFEVTAASDTYVYVVPMMVAEATEYMLAELTTLGWEELGKPTVMGHLATLNLQMDKDRLAVSMQDNERSETTRIQMVLMQQ